jgi:cytochrome c553
MFQIVAAQLSARRRDTHGRTPHQQIESPFYVIEQRTTLATRTASVAGKAFAALALVLAAALPSAPSAFAADSQLDAHSSLVATCAACHGATGAGSSAMRAPRLAGQNADYMAHALSMFKAGTRKNAVMQPIAQKLSDSDMRALADYFAAQHPPLAPAEAAPQAAQVAAGEQLAHSGDGANLAACFSCHAAGGQGNGTRFPSIAGQPATFVVARLHEFQDRAKKGNVKPGSMTAIAAQMSETQIETSAAYLSTLPR